MLDVSRATIISGGLLPPLAQSARQLLTLFLWTCEKKRQLDLLVNREWLDRLSARFICFLESRRDLLDL